MALPKVGVVIPAYNAEPYIADCLRSALDQDYPNLHLYVVDDASTDLTRRVMWDVVDTHPHQITWSSRSQNRGQPYTRQEATDMALADGCSYIVPLDADDVRKPNSIAPQVSLLEVARDAAVCYGATDIINAQGDLHPNPRWEQYAAKVKGRPEGEVWAQLIARGKLGTMDTVVIRDEAARACCYDTACQIIPDVDYLAQIATLPRKSHFVAVNEVVASYRFHAHQAMDRFDKDEHLRLLYNTMQTIALRVFHRLQQQGRAVPRKQRRILWRCLVVRAMLNVMRRGRWADLADLMRDLLRPIKRLEAPYRDLRRTRRLNELLGVWAADAC